jgi:hypothetical protein
MRTCDQPALEWTVVLRRQPVRIEEGRPEGSDTDKFELSCCDCGDHPDLDYRDMPPHLHHIRGPCPIAAGVAAYEEHLKLGHERVPDSRVPADGGCGFVKVRLLRQWDAMERRARRWPPAEADDCGGDLL